MWRTDRAGRRGLVAATWVVIGAGTVLCRAGDRPYPIDCLPDRVAVFEPVAANPQALFGAAFVPGIVLGPPGNSLPTEGSLTIASLGTGGSVVLAFDDSIIEDGPGPDFIVFENAFFKTPLPTTGASDFRVFAEPGLVEVSLDGELWFPIPFDAAALAAVAALPQGASVGPPLWFDLDGLAGRTPSFTGNWTVADDPDVFDPAGQAGVSGAGGDAFDLADAGVAEARFVRITDAVTGVGFPGQGEGFDLDAVVVLHGRPLTPRTIDSDGDLLSDREEAVLHGSDPQLADSDGDGTDDGREVAACRDPTSVALSADLHAEPRLWVRGPPSCTELRWTFMGTGRVYDVVRGQLGALGSTPTEVGLGPVNCLVNNDTDVRHACDSTIPPATQAWFYLVRVDGQGHYGLSSDLTPRLAQQGACP